MNLFSLGMSYRTQQIILTIMVIGYWVSPITNVSFTLQIA